MGVGGKRGGVSVIDFVLFVAGCFIGSFMGFFIAEELRRYLDERRGR